MPVNLSYKAQRLAVGGENMSGSDDFYDVILDRLTDPGTVALIRRALAQQVVLDTWMNGEQEETVSDAAGAIISDAAEDLTGRAISERAVFPHLAMPEGYVRAAFYEMMSGTALYQAQKRYGVRAVDTDIARDAVRMVNDFIRREAEGSTSACGYYFVLSAHEDLNAIHYYRRMKREDFLLGSLHRPWSDMMLTNQMEMYRAAGLVRQTITSEGEMLELTSRGKEILRHLRQLLQESGEFEWRSNAQRWVIFGETDYDQVHRTVLPDDASISKGFIDRLTIPPWARVLEIGAGTGRATLDLGLARRVKEAGGTLVALEPSGALLHSLRRKCMARGATNVEIVQGAAEALPFQDGSFDLVVSIVVLHFTELKRALSEMARVVKPGGQVNSVSPLQMSVFDIPMVAKWFSPLRMLAQELGVSLGERQGIPPGKVIEAYQEAGLTVEKRDVGRSRVIATDYRSFEQFVLKGGAFFQNILSRLPYQERWSLLRMLDRTGEEMVATTAPDEQKSDGTLELVWATKAKVPNG